MTENEEKPGKKPVPLATEMSRQMLEEMNESVSVSEVITAVKNQKPN